MAGLFLLTVMSLVFFGPACGGEEFRTNVPELVHPADKGSVYVTLPYFEWKDVVPHPYPGSYEIEIAEDGDFARLLDEDRIPALLSWYSPTVEMSPGKAYFWRVRYRGETGAPGPWSRVATVNCGRTHAIDVAAGDGWSELQAKFAQVAEWGDTHRQAAELRFPVGHTFHLTQDPDDPMLFQQPGRGNFVINGRGSTLVLRRTRTADSHCGLLHLENQSRIQLRDLAVDYEADSLSHVAGVVSDLDLAAGTFTVTIDPDVYRNYHEFKHWHTDGFFLRGDSLQRMGDRRPTIATNTWEQARQSDAVFCFTTDHWGTLDREVQNGDYFVAMERGGDLIHLRAGVHDFVASGVTSRACRSRWFIVRKESSTHHRCINNRFLRTQGRILGAASGGVNCHGDHAWFESTAFEHSRDDTYHCGGDGVNPAGPGQAVIRHCTIKNSVRNPILAAMDRHWVAGNTITLCGNSGMGLGTGNGGPDGPHCMLDVALVEDNVITRPYRRSVTSEVFPQWPPDPVTGYYNQYVTIRNNTIIDHQQGPGFQLNNFKHVVFENNTIANTSDGFNPYHDPASQIGIHVLDCIDVVGGGNVVSDTRIAPERRLVVEPSCRDVRIELSPRAP